LDFKFAIGSSRNFNDCVETLLSPQWKFFVIGHGAFWVIFSFASNSTENQQKE